MTIHVIETIIACKGKAKELESALLDVSLPTRKEKGCLYYEVFSDIEKEGCFFVIMCWENHASLLDHHSSPHIKVFEKQYDGILYSEASESILRKL